nr:hypothetical protein [Tanacetum cinerariifolium]
MVVVVVIFSSKQGRRRWWSVGELYLHGEGSKMGDADINMLSMEQYWALTQGNQAFGMVKPKIRNNVNFKIKSHLRELREDTFYNIP